MSSLRTVIVIKPNLHEEEHANSTQNEAQTSRFRTNLCLTCIKPNRHLCSNNRSVVRSNIEFCFKKANSAFSLYFPCSVTLAV